MIWFIIGGVGGIFLGMWIERERQRNEESQRKIDEHRANAEKYRREHGLDR